ncbi:MAG: hypothetical protein KDC98_11060, partial [Planctomycetes bacterium]|nr:hypothetical protein [Planctomycetota bacterium]
MRQSRDAFPAGLYGMLLVAVFGLTLPSLFSRIERVLVGTAAIVPHVLGSWTANPVAAAGPAELARIGVLRRALADGVRHHDVRGAEPLMPAGFEPIVCSVVSSARRGGAGQPSVLRLDRTHAELVGCSELVTKGNALLGFLQRPGVGLAVDDSEQDFALVVLLNDRSSRRVAAAMEFDGGGALRMV